MNTGGIETAPLSNGHVGGSGNGAKIGIIHMTEDLIRKSVVGDTLRIDGTHLERKIRLIEGMDTVHSLLKAREREGDGFSPLREHGKDVRGLRVLCLSGHIISRMGAVSCLKFLEELDLSDNRIETIEGLDLLTRFVVPRRFLQHGAIERPGGS